jgi:hypothetical protein
VMSNGWCDEDVIRLGTAQPGQRLRMVVVRSFHLLSGLSVECWYGQAVDLATGSNIACPC